MKYLKYFCFFYVFTTHVIIIYYLFITNYMRNSVSIKNANNYYHFYGDGSHCKLGLDINEDILNMLNMSNLHGVQLFIVQSNRLNKYLNASDLETLNKQIFFDSSVANTESTVDVNEISFGVFDDTGGETKFNNFLEAIQHQNADSFHCEGDYDYHSISNTTSHNNDVISRLRYYCVKGRTKVYLIKFMKRHEFYWFIELTNAHIIYAGSYLSDKNETNFISTFDAFGLTKCHINDIHWYLPDDIRYFLAQTKSSRFIPCLINATKMFRRKYRDAANVKITLKVKVENVLRAFKKIMKKELKQFWIIGGTLLGWVRQCGVFTHTTDVDLVTWSHYASDQFTERLIANNRSGVRLTSVYGFVDEAYEMSFKMGGMSVDLFYNYQINNDSYAVATHVKDAYKYSYYSHAKYQLCSAELYGIIVNIPCNPIDVVVNTYGKNWTKPIKNWDWYESPRNKGKDVYWDKQRKHNAFKTFN